MKLGKMPRWDIWDEFQFCPNRNEIVTDEPKFSNNVKTLPLRPNFRDKLNNFYHANSYTRTITNTFNMESGAEAGVKVANIINNSYVPEKIKISPFIRFCRWCDKIIFRICKIFKF